MFDRGSRKTAMRRRLREINSSEISEDIDPENISHLQRSSIEASSFKMEFPNVAESFACDVFGKYINKMC